MLIVVCLYVLDIKLSFIPNLTITLGEMSLFSLLTECFIITIYVEIKCFHKKGIINKDDTNLLILTRHKR